jgi:activating signal cointegrator 1
VAHPVEAVRVKTLTLHQPWATLVARAVKTIETRSWSTGHRGPLAIHAGRAIPPTLFYDRRLMVGGYEVERDNPRGSSPAYLLRHASLAWPYRLPLGEVVATCTLVDVVAVEDVRFDGTAGSKWIILMSPGRDSVLSQSGNEPLGDFFPGRFAWLLADIEPLAKPVPARGRQGLWEWAAQ